MRSINIFIPGIPVPKGRPRFFVVHGQPRVFTPKETERYENIVRMYCIDHRPAEYMTGPVAIAMTFQMPRAKSLPKAQTFHTKRPDFDNLEKAICDGLKKAAIYKDDSQIFLCTTEKIYSDKIGVSIKVTYIENEQWTPELRKQILLAEV